MLQQNGLVARLHRQLEASLITILNDRGDWPSALPMVLSSMRAAYKADLGTSSAHLIFVEALLLPGEFFRGPDEQEKQRVSKRTRAILQFIRSMKLTPTTRHRPPVDNRSFVSAAITGATQVFVRTDGHKASLQAPYKRPYPALERDPEAFMIDLDRKTDSVAITLENSEPQVICDPEVASLPNALPAEASSAVRQSRAGRALRLPQRFIDTST